MSTRTALLLAVLVFLGTLLARLPARTLLPLLPTQISCQMPIGTVWQGGCTQLRSGPLTLTSVSWSLHPSALLRGRLSAQLSSADPRASGQAAVEVSHDGELAVHDLAAQLALKDGLSVLPHGLGGTVLLQVAHARLQHGDLTQLEGSVRVLQLRSESQAADLGSFELSFPPAEPGAPVQGRLFDLGGPLSVSGQLRLTRGGGYDLSGTVAARPGANPDLVQALQLLGPADAQGRRTFSLAGTL